MPIAARFDRRIWAWRVHSGRSHVEDGVPARGRPVASRYRGRARRAGRSPQRLVARDAGWEELIRRLAGLADAGVARAARQSIESDRAAHVGVGEGRAVRVEDEVVEAQRGLGEELPAAGAGGLAVRAVLRREPRDQVVGRRRRRPHRGGRSRPSLLDLHGPAFGRHSNLVVDLSSLGAVAAVVGISAKDEAAVGIVGGDVIGPAEERGSTPPRGPGWRAGRSRTMGSRAARRSSAPAVRARSSRSGRRRSAGDARCVALPVLVGADDVPGDRRAVGVDRRVERPLERARKPRRRPARRRAGKSSRSVKT